MAVVRPVSFRRDVMPVFMRAGCNTGACHGSARGKDGFRLSLFGFDPEGDYFRLTRELGYRRVKLAVPEESLVLQKALGAVPHTGGKRPDPSSEYAKTIVCGLQVAGSPNDPPGVPAVEGIELFPPEMLLEGAGAKQQMIARARYSDGSQRDVTPLALFNGILRSDRQRPDHASGPIRRSDRLDAAGRAGRGGRPAGQLPQGRHARLHAGRLQRRRCHGSARGKDGFRLSLFGFDPEGDHFRLTRELGYRRVNLAVPEESLVLQKALGAVPHTGGKRFEPSSEYAKTLVAWLQAGAPNDPPTRADRGKRRDFPP